MNEERPSRILIAEDDEDIVKVLKLYLENQGYKVLTAENGKIAADLLKAEPADLGIFDIMMPEMDGYELIREVRRTSDMPIIVLSAKQEDADKIIGLDLGADDYLVKPFNPLEVLARVRAQLRRYHEMGHRQDPDETAAPSRLTVGSLSVDLQSLTLSKDGEEISLTPTELRILIFLMKNPGKVFTKVQLNKFLNGSYIQSDDNSLMVHISNLREKIEEDPRHPQYLLTVRGLGYKFKSRQ